MGFLWEMLCNLHKCRWTKKEMCVTSCASHIETTPMWHSWAQESNYREALWRRILGWNDQWNNNNTLYSSSEPRFLCSATSDATFKSCTVYLRNNLKLWLHEQQKYLVPLNAIFTYHDSHCFSLWHREGVWEWGWLGFWGTRTINMMECSI